MKEKNELALFESKALVFMQDLSNLKKEQDRLTNLEKTARENLQKVMSDYGITQFKNEYVTISVVKGSTTVSVDLKALEKNEPQLYADLLKDYPKETVKKDSVRILVK